MALVNRTENEPFGGRLGKVGRKLLVLTGPFVLDGRPEKSGGTNK
jgi:hypothetical protein